MTIVPPALVQLILFVSHTTAHSAAPLLLPIVFMGCLG